MKIFLVTLLAAAILFLALLLKSIQDRVLSQMKPKIRPQISPILEPMSINTLKTNLEEDKPTSLDKQPKKPNLNTNAHNPEIVSTNNWMLFLTSIITIAPFLALLLFFKLSIISSDVLGLSKEFIFIQFELVPYYFTNFVNPLVLYCQNKRLRKFVMEHINF